jgi:hypothetical protein
MSGSVTYSKVELNRGYLVITNILSPYQNTYTDFVLVIEVKQYIDGSTNNVIILDQTNKSVLKAVHPIGSNIITISKATGSFNDTDNLSVSLTVYNSKTRASSAPYIINFGDKPNTSSFTALASNLLSTLMQNTAPSSDMCTCNTDYSSVKYDPIIDFFNLFVTLFNANTVNDIVNVKATLKTISTINFPLNSGINAYLSKVVELVNELIVTPVRFSTPNDGPFYIIMRVGKIVANLTKVAFLLTYNPCNNKNKILNKQAQDKAIAIALFNAASDAFLHIVNDFNDTNVLEVFVRAETSVKKLLSQLNPNNT